MSEWGVTEKGFKRKSRDEIVSDMISVAKNLFGGDINTDDRNPLIKIIKIASYALSLKWYVMEKLYNSRWINTASGESLNNLVQYVGISRRPAVKSIGKAEFSGDEGTEIPENFIIETDESEPKQFETIESGVIGESESITLDIRAIKAGTDGNVPPNTITVIVNPISGLSKVTNPEGTDNGLEIENDYELRERYKDSVERPGGSTVNSIRAALLDIDEVRAALVIENDSESTEDGIPPKSIESVVLGGIDYEIAEKIFETKAGGIKAYGNEIVEVEDDAGLTKEIGFTQATKADVYCSILVNVNNDFLEDGEEQIKDEIIEYIGGYNSDGELRFGTGLGENVFWSKIIDKIHNVDGVEEVQKLDIGKDDWDDISGIGNEIEIDTREVAETSLDFILFGNIKTGNSFANIIHSKVATNRQKVDSKVNKIKSDVQTETD